ncbi:hypothetical protein, partial [[Ruminococcus] lactaris]|uniref:hypothetical protein n=1 Tax=[Ruminococcus] lactaris TaxID=46228 RepID=UPI0023B16D34
LFFYYNTLLQTSTYKNGKFDIKKAGFIRPARYFSNIQLSNSRGQGEGDPFRIGRGWEWYIASFFIAFYLWIML